MTAQTYLSRPCVVDMVSEIIACGKITRVNQQRFMLALLSQESISQADRALINRMFDLLRAGRLRVVD